MNINNGIYLQQQPDDRKGLLLGLLGTRGAAWLPVMAKRDGEGKPTWGWGEPAPALLNAFQHRHQFFASQ